MSENIHSYVPESAQLEENVIISSNVKVGEYVKIGKHSYIFDNSFVGCSSSIGRYCSISYNTAIAPGQHPKNLLSTSVSLYPKYSDILFERYKGKPFHTYQEIPEIYDQTFEIFKPAKIGNDVWIGRNVVIMDGVEVSDGCIIGANAVVTKNVEPYAIVVGTPAKVLGYRFSKEIIDKLLELKWWSLPDDKLVDLPLDINECIEYLKSK